MSTTPRDADASPPPQKWERRLGIAPPAPWAAAPIAIGAGGGAIVAGTIAVLALVRDRPVPNVGFLIIPAVPLLAIGQIWAIAQVKVRQPPRQPGKGRSLPLVARSRGSFSLSKQRAFFFGDLRPLLAYLVMAGFFAGWLMGWTGFSGLRSGNPSEALAGCPFPLVNHGVVTCVSRAAYQHAGASGQRSGAGVLFSFFCVHLGVALGRLDRFRTHPVEPVQR